MLTSLSHLSISKYRMAKTRSGSGCPSSMAVCFRPSRHFEAVFRHGSLPEVIEQNGAGAQLRVSHTKRTYLRCCWDCAWCVSVLTVSRFRDWIPVPITIKVSSVLKSLLCLILKQRQRRHVSGGRKWWMVALQSDQNSTARPILINENCWTVTISHQLIYFDQN